MCVEPRLSHIHTLIFSHAFNSILEIFISLTHEILTDRGEEFTSLPHFFNLADILTDPTSGKLQLEFFSSTHMGSGGVDPFGLGLGVGPLRFRVLGVAHHGILRIVLIVSENFLLLLPEMGLVEVAEIWVHHSLSHTSLLLIH